jgi:hypothetical protein
MDATRTAHRHGRFIRRNLCVMKGARPMRMSIALPIVAALAAVTLGPSGLTPAHAKQKSPAACKKDNIACT